jgi:hypothetical protein
MSAAGALVGQLLPIGGNENTVAVLWCGFVAAVQMGACGPQFYSCAALPAKHLTLFTITALHGDGDMLCLDGENFCKMLL